MSRAIPQAVIDRYKRLVATYGPGVAADLAGISRNAGLRIRRRGYAAARLGVQEKPFPADFSVMANRMTKKDLMRHYRVGQVCLDRWLSRVDRDYRIERRDISMPVPPRERIEAAMALGSIPAACAALGVNKSTLVKWRRHYGMPIASRRTARMKRFEAIEAEQLRLARRWGGPVAYRGPDPIRTAPSGAEWTPPPGAPGRQRQVTA